MPVGVERLAAWAHPVLAVVSLVILFQAASLGLRSRERRGAPLRPRHARLAPWALWTMGANVVIGLGSTWLWRDDLELGGGAHFWIGLATFAVLAAAAWISRRLPDERAKRLHPLLGMLALLLASLQTFLGLQLLPL